MRRAVLGRGKAAARGRSPLPCRGHGAHARGTPITTLRHVILPLGEVRDVERPASPPEGLEQIGLWVDQLSLRWDRVVPLPGAMSDYSARAYMSDRGLVMTIGGIADTVLAIFAVMGREQADARLWSQFCFVADVEVGEPPPEPWVAVIPTDHLATDPGAAAWMHELQLSVAWAWIDRNLQ